jgi:hypothetical protein
VFQWDLGKGVAGAGAPYQKLGFLEWDAYVAVNTNRDCSWREADEKTLDQDVFHELMHVAGAMHPRDEEGAPFWQDPDSMQYLMGTDLGSWITYSHEVSEARKAHGLRGSVFDIKKLLEMEVDEVLTNVERKTLKDYRAREEARSPTPETKVRPPRDSAIPMPEDDEFF